MAGSGFTLSGKDMTSVKVNKYANLITRPDGTYYVAVGATAAAKYRRNEIICAWELGRDRLMKVMSQVPYLLSTTGTELVCKIALPNVKNYSILVQPSATVPEDANIIVGFSYLAPTFVTGVPPDEITWNHTGRPQQLGSVGLDCAVTELIQAYLRLNSKD